MIWGVPGLGNWRVEKWPWFSPTTNPAPMQLGDFDQMVGTVGCFAQDADRIQKRLDQVLAHQKVPPRGRPPGGNSWGMRFFEMDTRCHPLIHHEYTYSILFTCHESANQHESTLSCQERLRCRKDPGTSLARAWGIWVLLWQAGWHVSATAALRKCRRTLVKWSCVQTTCRKQVQEILTNGFQTPARLATCLAVMFPIVNSCYIIPCESCAKHRVPPVSANIVGTSIDWKEYGDFGCPAVTSFQWPGSVPTPRLGAVISSLWLGIAAGDSFHQVYIIYVI